MVMNKEPLMYVVDSRPYTPNEHLPENDIIGFTPPGDYQDGLLDEQNLVD